MVQGGGQARQEANLPARRRRYEDVRAMYVAAATDYLFAGGMTDAATIFSRSDFLTEVPRRT
jgi:hypothetical protein